MERTSVQSSYLASAGYDLDTLTLEIEFNTGGIYQYSGVPQEVYDGLMTAGSKGTFFHQFIRKGGYPYVKVC